MEYVQILDPDKSIYETIYRVFSDKNQADAIASIFEKVLIQANTATRRLIEEKKYEILEAMKQELDRRNYATKSDLEAGLANLELKLMQEIGKIRVDIANVRTEIAEVRTELKEEINNVRTELKEDIANVRTEIANVRTELKEDINNVRTELVGMIKDTQKQVATLATSVEGMQKGFDHKINSFKFAIIKWVVGSIIASITVASGVITFFIRSF